MLEDKFIALMKAILLLGILLAILLFNTDLPKLNQSSTQTFVDEIAVNEEVERLVKDKITADTAQKYRQQVLQQEEEEYQNISGQGKEYVKSLTIQQRKEQQQLNKLKRHRLQAEQELKKIRQERKKLSKSNANPSVH